MKYLLLVVMTLLSMEVFAGSARLNWQTTSYQQDSPLTNTEFKILWGVEGQPLENEIVYGPPAPAPQSFVEETASWQTTEVNAAWVPGLRVCFQLAVSVSGREQGRSPMACKTFLADMSVPVNVNLYYP